MMSNQYNSNLFCCPNCSDWEDYTIKEGDTLYSISLRYGVPLKMLMSCNKVLNPYNLPINQVIKVPPTPPTLLGCDGPNDDVYIIQLRDSLYTIAERYSTTVEALMERNPGLDPYNLKPGTRICVPKVTVSPAPVIPEITPPVVSPVPPIEEIEEVAVCDGRIYTIQEGDTLYNLLNTYDFTYTSFIFANPDIDFMNLIPGATVCIPRHDSFRGCNSGTTYIIRSGDSLNSLATKFSVSQDSLLRANQFYRPSDFSVMGNKICIPDFDL